MPDGSSSTRRRKASTTGFVGGLLEHTLHVTQICDFFCKLYPMLNRDLLLCAAMLHDMGKLKELSRFPANDYTDEGQLLGHIVIGAMEVQKHIEAIPDFPERTASELIHCILGSSRRAGIWFPEETGAGGGHCLKLCG